MADHSALDRGEDAVLRHAHLVVDDHVVPSAAGGEHLLHGIDELDGLTRLLGEHDHTEIAGHGIVLRAAEASADIGLDDAYLAQGKLEAGGEMTVVKIGALLGRPDRDVARWIVVGERGGGFQKAGQHLSRLEAVFP